MFEGFTTTDIETNGARIHLRHGGKGPPLLLLHGNPLTHVSYAKLAARLADRFTIVTGDLRGYGDSVGPDDPGPNSENYSFRTMARDHVEVMEKLGFKQFYVAGHDRGARTAHRMGLDHPDRVMRLATMDILPSHYVWSNMSKKWFTNAYHWLFMAQPAPFPETLMTAVDGRWFLEKKLSKPGVGLKFFGEEAFEEYVRCFTPRMIKASCDDYRACAGIDFEMDEADLAAGNKLKMPVCVLWGGKSNTGTAHGDLLPLWQTYCDRPVTGGPVPCGHYVPEESPDEVAEWFTKFFKD